MKIHRQSPTKAIVKEDEIIGYGDRRMHSAAADTTCPRCDARPGGLCKEGGEFLPALDVHLERAEAHL